MKKLMLAMAVAAICSSSFAYNYRWKIGSAAVYAGDTETKVAEGTQAYLFNARDYSQATLLMALFDDGKSIDTITANKQLAALSASATSVYNTYSAKSATVGTEYVDSDTTFADVYFAIFSSDGKSVFVSDTKKQTIDQSSGSATTSISFAAALVNASQTSKEYELDSGDFNGGAWYTAAVTPEPTSGLLLLIGMAGLALKRKRA